MGRGTRATMIGIALACVLASAGATDVESVASHRHARHRILARRSLATTGGSLNINNLNVSQCIWDGVGCLLSSEFVADLPSLLGNPNTSSAEALARAALRSNLCAALPAKPACLASASASGCRWDDVLAACSLEDVIDVNMLRNVVYCPGSRIDDGVACAALSNDPAACVASAHNCKRVYGTQATGTDLAGRLLGLVSGLSGQVADALGIASATVQAVADNATALVNASTACAPAWAADSAFLGSLAGGILSSISGGDDILSALLTPRLFGSCAGNQRLRDTLAACPLAATAPACAALGGCEWLDAAGACAMATDFVSDLVLDPTDPWVTVYNNASAVCRTIRNATNCDRVDALTLDPALLAKPASLIGSLGGSGAGAGAGSNSSSDGGGAAAVLPSMVLHALAAVACLGALLLL